MAKKQKSANRKKNIAKADASSDIRSKANRVARQRKKRGSFKEYFKGVRLEMKKVVWPTKNELASFTGVVKDTLNLLNSSQIDFFNAQSEILKLIIEDRKSVV